MCLCQEKIKAYVKKNLCAYVKRKRMPMSRKKIKHVLLSKRKNTYEVCRMRNFD